MAKAKKCRICKTEFHQFRSTQVVCSTKCAIEHAYQVREKRFKVETSKLRKDLDGNDKKLQAKLAQKAVNRFIRARDYNEPCISCGTTRPDIQYCAGHYLTRGGHPELRFNEDNINKQCNKRCNLELSGNIAAYRVNLVKKIGVERVEVLEGPHDIVKYTIDDYNAINKKYNKLAREIEKGLTI